MAGLISCLTSSYVLADEVVPIKKDDLQIKIEQPNLPSVRNSEFLEQVRKLKKSQEYAKKNYNFSLHIPDFF